MGRLDVSCNRHGYKALFEHYMVGVGGVVQYRSRKFADSDTSHTTILHHNLFSLSTSFS